MQLLLTELKVLIPKHGEHSLKFSLVNICKIILQIRVRVED